MHKRKHTKKGIAGQEGSERSDAGGLGDSAPSKPKVKGTKESGAIVSCQFLFIVLADRTLGLYSVS